VLHELAEHAAGQNTRLVLQLPPAPLTVIADKTQVAVAVRAVLVNALEALVTGGTIEVMVEQAESETARVTVRDTGPGFGAEVARHLFDPFYSGREAGRGLGFGLSKCWRIVTLHGGTVTAESEPGRGATFTICLPMLPVR